MKKLPTHFALLFVAIYALAVYLLSEEKAVQLPEQQIPICLYSNQADGNLRNTFTQAILEANSSIYCLIYSLNDEEIISALKKKAASGVQVVVVADPVATQDGQKKLGTSVEFVPRRQKGLMHNKLLAIDNKVSFLGSANFTRDSLSTHANLVMGIESEQIAQAISDKAVSLRDKGKKIEPLKIQAGEQCLELSFLPDDPKALDKVLTCLKAAQKTIKVAMFTFTHPDLIEALVAAHKRGVDVQVVIDSDSSRKTSSKAYTRFKNEKMQVFASRRDGLLHEKVAIIDDSTLIMGSANWTRAAFSQNSENIAILRNLTPVQQKILALFWATTLQET